MATKETQQEEKGVGLQAAPPGEGKKEATEPLPTNYARTNGLGALNVLDDALLLKIFHYFSAEDLMQICFTSHAFYIFSDEEELWHDLCIDKYRGNFNFKGTWRRTYLMPREKDPSSAPPYRKLPIQGFYSAHLYAQWYKAHVPMHYWAQLPSDLPANKQVERRSARTLSVSEFLENYARQNRPVILTDLVTSWPSWRDKSWTPEALLRRFASRQFRVDQTDGQGKKLVMTLQDYFAYVNLSHDADPIYIFCPRYARNAPEMLADYDVPEYFREDFLASMGAEKRPHYRWVVIGGPRSGSPFHLDPFRTAAWNALLEGRKRWTFYPPNVFPPGLVFHEGGDYVGADPIDWFIHHYPNIRARKDQLFQPIECIQEPGELIFVPSNWWHMVMNLETSVAVTQNYCDETNFTFVYEDMKTDPLSHVLFTEKMLRYRPDLLKQVVIPPEFWKLSQQKEQRKLAKRLQRLQLEQATCLHRIQSDAETKKEVEEKELEKEKEKDVEKEKEKENEEKEEKEWSVNFWRTPVPLIEDEAEDTYGIGVDVVHTESWSLSSLPTSSLS
ncbi:Histone lysine demethylase JMJD6b [Balamuthia mandrillaris]